VRSPRPASARPPWTGTTTVSAPAPSSGARTTNDRPSQELRRPGRPRPADTRTATPCTCRPAPSRTRGSSSARTVNPLRSCLPPAPPPLQAVHRPSGGGPRAEGRPSRRRPAGPGADRRSRRADAAQRDRAVPGVRTRAATVRSPSAPRPDGVTAVMSTATGRPVGIAGRAGAGVGDGVGWPHRRPRGRGGCRRQQRAVSAATNRETTNRTRPGRARPRGHAVSASLAWPPGRSGARSGRPAVRRLGERDPGGVDGLWSGSPPR
jgi:hypothetical protein